MNPPTKALKHVKLIPGTAPGTWTVATAFLGNPVGDRILAGMALGLGEPATTRDLPEPQATAMARRVERYIAEMEK